MVRSRCGSGGRRFAFPPYGPGGFEVRKVFFFEKKKQKTFVFVGRIFYPPTADGRKGADSSATANKSFLVLFFKKELFLPSLPSQLDIL